MSEYLMYMFKNHVHVSIRKNFGGMTIFLSGSQKLKWTQTYDPHCIITPHCNMSVVNRSYMTCYFIYRETFKLRAMRSWAFGPRTN